MSRSRSRIVVLRISDFVFAFIILLSCGLSVFMFWTKTKTKKIEKRWYCWCSQAGIRIFFRNMILEKVYGKSPKKLFPERKIHWNFLLNCSLSTHPPNIILRDVSHILKTHVLRGVWNNSRQVLVVEISQDVFTKCIYFNAAIPDKIFRAK